LRLAASTYRGIVLRGELRELIEGFVEHGCHWVFEDVSNRTSIDWTVKLIPRSSFCITHGA